MQQIRIMSERCAAAAAAAVAAVVPAAGCM